MIKLLTICTQFCTVCSSILLWMAYEYEYFGHGLNPFVALPLSTLFLMIPYMIDHFFVEMDGDDYGPSFITLKLKRTMPDSPDPKHPQTIEDYNCNDRECEAVRHIQSGASDFPKDVF